MSISPKMNDDFITKQLTNFLERQPGRLGHEEINGYDGYDVADDENEVQLPANVLQSGGSGSGKCDGADEVPAKAESLFSLATYPEIKMIRFELTMPFARNVVGKISEMYTNCGGSMKKP